MPVLWPGCESPVEVEEGDTIVCEDCGAGLEVVSLEPLTVKAEDDSGYDDAEELPFIEEDE